MSAPKDIDEKELTLRYRRKRIDRKLIKITANELARVIPLLVREACVGCQTGHLSQTHHTCLTWGKLKRVECFDTALERVSVELVMNTLMDKLSATDLDVLHHYPLAEKFFGITLRLGYQARNYIFNWMITTELHVTLD